MFELLWYSQMPCFDVKGLTSKVKDELSFLKKCMWKNTDINCNAIFIQRPTDQGMCCSFNMVKADKILTKSRYTKAISARQSEDSEAAFDDNEPPQWYKNNKEPNPQAGRNKGLTLIIDGHSNKVSSGTVKQNYKGFITLVDDNDKFPLLSSSKLILRPGFESNIEVDAIQLDSKDETKKYGPQRRNCYFPDEKKLDIHKRYSQFNCMFECKEEFASKCLTTCDEPGQQCNCQPASKINSISLKEKDSCVPWYYPTAARGLQKMCNPWNTVKFLKIIETQMPDNQCKHCLPDCTTTNFETGITYAELPRCDRTNVGGTSMLCALVDDPLNPAPWMTTAQKEFMAANQTIPWYLDTNSSRVLRNEDHARFSNQRSMINDVQKRSNLIFSSGSEGAEAYDAFKKDIGIVNIFFGKDKILRYVTSNKMSTSEFLSQMGGLLGLFMGVSFISIIELIYWFTIRFYRNA